jgi:hypothetical protein
VAEEEEEEIEEGTIMFEQPQINRSKIAFTKKESFQDLKTDVYSGYSTQLNSSPQAFEATNPCLSLSLSV